MRPNNIGKHIDLWSRMIDSAYGYLDKHKSKYRNFKYIYPISYKIAKKGKPLKKDLPY